MSIKVVVAKAHKNQLNNADAIEEINNIEEIVNENDIVFKENTINYFFIKGFYNHKNRSMLTIGLLVNKMDSPVKEVHGALRMKFKHEQALIAKATLDFDEQFIGVINPDEALLVHLNVPVKGLEKDKEFYKVDLDGSFDDVRVTI
ncbi:hypothetical protein [Pseudobutyrivibrio sp.]